MRKSFVWGLVFAVLLVGFIFIAYAATSEKEQSEVITSIAAENPGHDHEEC